MTLDARFIKGDTNRLQEFTIVDPRFPRGVERLRKSCSKLRFHLYSLRTVEAFEARLRQS